MNRSINVVRLAAIVSPVLAMVSASHAYLGGFESADGYQPFLNMVQNYNAGQYGVNSGYVAPSPVAIAPNSGLWQALAGGFNSGSAISYVTGHQFRDRTYTNTNGGSGLASDQALVITTGHEGWSGPALKYKYNVDASDLGGVAPSTTGNTTVKLSFWVDGYLYGSEFGGSVPEGYFGNEINFADGSGNVGFSLGLTQHASGDTITYWNGASMVDSGIVSSGSKFDRWDISLDLASDTFSASYFHFNTSTAYNLVNNMPMMSAMGAFEAMNFRSSAGVNNTKFFAVDDFAFFVRDVPTPGALALLGLGGLAAVRRRR